MTKEEERTEQSEPKSTMYRSASDALITENVQRPVYETVDLGTNDLVNAEGDNQMSNQSEKFVAILPTLAVAIAIISGVILMINPRFDAVEDKIDTVEDKIDAKFDKLADMMIVAYTDDTATSEELKEVWDRSR